MFMFMILSTIMIKLHDFGWETECFKVYGSFCIDKRLQFISESQYADSTSTFCFLPIKKTYTNKSKKVLSHRNEFVSVLIG